MANFPDQEFSKSLVGRGHSHSMMHGVGRSRGMDLGRGRGRGVNFWNWGEIKPLRRPHPNTLAELYKNQASDADSNATAEMPGPTEQDDNAAGASAEVEDVNSWKDVLQLMNDIIDEVTDSPGSFELETELLLHDFNIWGRSSVTMKSVVAMIVAESVARPNFRYSGARLCNIMMQKSREMQFHTFMEYLNIELNDEREKTFDLVYGNPDRVHGFLMFLAELCVQFEGEAPYLCIFICYVVNYLLMRGKPENLKYICQALKLSGRCIDKQATGEMDVIMEYLLKISNRACTDKYTSSNISSLAELRSSNWGESAQSESKDTASFSDAYVDSEPIFYGPDGTVLSAEENRFLQENLDDSTDDDDLKDLLNKEDPMDEMDEAFEEFLRFSNQN